MLQPFIDRIERTDTEPEPCPVPVPRWSEFVNTCPDAARLIDQNTLIGMDATEICDAIVELAPGKWQSDADARFRLSAMLMRLRAEILRARREAIE